VTGPLPVADLLGVGRAYPGPPPVAALRDATVTLRAGEYVALVGRSGSGKSTLVNIIALLDRPTSGTYLLNGTDTAALSEAERAGLRGRSIGVVFQSFHLMSWRTAAENVALAGLYAGVRRRDRLTAAAEALDRVGMAHRAQALPAMLSGGECQRVAIARALAGRPSLLLCDEPTGNLDTAATAVVLELLGQLHRDGATILMITHDPLVAARAGRRLTMADGIVRDTGDRAAVSAASRAGSPCGPPT
jgi:putative ABC transport system ATP-binding protein